MDPCLPVDGSTKPPITTSTAPSGCLTVKVMSYGSWTAGAGWSADVTCAPTPTCFAPTSRTVTSTAAHTASFSWNAGASPSVEYKVVAYGGTRNAPTITSGTSSTGSSTTAAGVLTPNTQYTAYFRGVCDGGTNPSAWSDPGLNFRTKPGCGAPYDLFPSSTYAAYSTPKDSVVTICPDNAGDVVTLTPTTFSFGWSGNGTVGLLVYDGSTTSAPQFNSGLPAKTYGANTLPVGAFYETNGGGYNNSHLPGPFTSSVAGGCLTLRFLAYSAGTYDTGMKANVTCSPAPCPVPTVVTFSNIGGTTATVSWGNTTHPCVLEYGPVGFTPGTGATAGTNGTVMSNVTSPVNLTGLSPTTTYDVYVRQVCDVTDYSSNSFFTRLTTSMDCSAAQVITCGVPVDNVFTQYESGTDAYTIATYTNASSCMGSSPGAETTGLERLFRFTVTEPGVHNLTIPANGVTKVGYAIAPVSSGCAASAFTCVGVGLAAGSSLNTTSLAAGDYYLIADAHSSYVGNQKFTLYCPGVPSCVTAPTYPANGSTLAVNTNNIAFTWPAAFGATAYDIYWNGSGTPLTTVATNSITPNGYTTAAVKALVGGVGNPVGWRAVPKNSYGTATCPTNWTFSVGANGSTEAIALTDGVVRTGNRYTTNGYSNINNVARMVRSGTSQTSTNFTGVDSWYTFVASECADSVKVNLKNTTTASRPVALILLDASLNGVVLPKQYDNGGNSGASTGVGIYASSLAANALLPCQWFDYDQYYYGTPPNQSITRNTVPTWKVTPGQRYYVVVDGYSNAPVGSQECDFEVSYTETKKTVDTDGDGTPDCLDACPENPDLTAETVCGCQVATDTDGDGIADCIDLCPSLAGEPGGPCNAGPFYLSGEIDDDCNCIGGTPVPTVDWSLKLKTDHGDETSWEIREVGSNFLVAHGDPVGTHSPTETTTPVTLPATGHFTLRVLDSGNNGMGADGGYVLRDANGKRVIDNWGNGGGFTSVSESPEGFTTPVGTDGLTAAQCDNVERLANEMIICNVNPLVSAKWGVGDQTTSGYEFWFFDPNGSYSRHILRPHATSGGYAPADATRAAKLGLASWSVNPLPANTLLNVRVRGRVEGVNLPFGPACRLKVDPVAAECHTTQLENLPGSNLSCGVTGLRTNGSNAIYAKPVRRYIAATNTYVSANRYKFHFENTGEGQHFDIVQSTYPMVIYSNMPFRLGATYDVTVQASMDGGVSYCPVGATCQISFATSNARMEEVAGTSPSDLLLWPNPNRGDELYLSMGQLEGTNGKVTVDVVNMFGERVLGTTVAVNGTSLNTVLSLNKDLASGLYLVNLTAGDRVDHQAFGDPALSTSLNDQGTAPASKEAGAVRVQPYPIR
ncbi:MAG: T9SS type A sorting domain-containing protein [Flavobacteriales bacterium]